MANTTTELCRAVKPSKNMNDKEIKACQRETINELRRLIIEHHSYNVMKPEHCTCPVCTQPSWDEVLNTASKLGKAGDEQPATPEPDELKALASATCSAAASADKWAEIGRTAATKAQLAVDDGKFGTADGHRKNAEQAFGFERQLRQPPNDQADRL
jgi:hypothetical protein